MLKYKVAIVEKVTKALKDTFNGSYEDVLLRGILVGPEYQLVKESYPSVLITYREQAVRSYGVGHVVTGVDDSGAIKHYHEWYYIGYVSFNIFALTTTERDTISDNLIKVVGFGYDSATTDLNFHTELSNDDYIILNLMSQSATPLGDSVLPVPWGASNEQLYNTGYSFPITGSFFSDPITNSLIRLNSVNMFPYRGDQGVPTGTNDPSPWPDA